MRAKVELATPIEVTVDAYSVELSLNGLTETPEVRSVANKWRLHDGTPSKPRSQPMTPLPLSLRSGHPVEGWIHFLTTRNQYELESSTITGVCTYAPWRWLCAIPARPWLLALVRKQLYNA